MKQNFLLFTVAAMVFAGCSTTVERTSSAFGGGWGTDSKKSNSTKTEATATAEKNTTQTLVIDETPTIAESNTATYTEQFETAVNEASKTHKFNAVEKVAIKQIAKKVAKMDQNAPVKEQSISKAEAATAGGLDDNEMIIAAILCFFLGYLGIHRFYLGYTTIGILQLITAGGCGIWASIDLIRILTGDLGRNPDA
jgi:hypothetical protein